MQKQENSSLNPQNGNPMLEDFIEISRPDDISWWPDTLGWQILLFLFILFICFRLYRVFEHYMNNAYRRWANQQLMLLTQSAEDIYKLPILLKKTAIYAYKRENIAELTGNDWETWLDQECQKTEFSQTPTSGLLSYLAYSPTPELTTEQFNQLKQQISHWIKYHQGAL